MKLNRKIIVDIGQKLLHSDKAGIFESLWISDELQENIVETDLWIEKNQKVGGFSAANEAIGTLIMRFESQEMLNRVLENQSKYIKVIVR